MAHFTGVGTDVSWTLHVYYPKRTTTTICIHNVHGRRVATQGHLAQKDMSNKTKDLDTS